MVNLQSTLGYRIRKLRKSCSLSQEQLGERANLHNTYIGAIERGERNPSLKSLEKIAHALNVQLIDLFRFMDYKTSPQEERIKTEIFSMLIGQDAKTLNLILNLIKQILNGLKQFLP